MGQSAGRGGFSEEEEGEGGGHSVAKRQHARHKGKPTKSGRKEATAALEPENER